MCSFTAAPLGPTRIPGLDARFPSAAEASSSLKRGDVIEIQGPASSGKTHLLYDLIGTCILPGGNSPNGGGGWDKVAILFDSDGCFDIRRLAQLLRARLGLRRMSSHPSPLSESPDGVTDTLARILRKVHIFRPSSSLQLAASIANLSAYHAAQLPTCEIGLVAVDSMSAFYWQDRLHAEETRPQADARGLDTPLSHILSGLQKFRISHGPVTVLTNWGLDLASSSSPDPSTKFHFYKQHLHHYPTLLHLNVNTDASSVSVSHASTHPHLPITHHITLNPWPNLHRTRLAADSTEQQTDHRCIPLTEGCDIIGVVKTAGSNVVGAFNVSVKLDEVLIGNGRHDLQQYPSEHLIRSSHISLLS